MEELGDPLQALLAGRARVVEFSGGRVFVDAPRAGRLYLSGSFNPLHDGHRCASPVGNKWTGSQDVGTGTSFASKRSGLRTFFCFWSCG